MAYYLIKSRMSDHVLDVEKGSKAGHKILTWDRHQGDNQIWFDDVATGTIRTKGNKQLCITHNGKHLVVDTYKPGDKGQQWMRQGQTIRNRVDQDQVLDVYHKKKEKGAEVGPYHYKGADNQHWEFIPMEGSSAGVASAYYQGQRKEFFIVSDMHGKVIDIAGEKADPGGKLIMYDKSDPPRNNQLWYLDNLGLIRSALSDLVFTNTKKGEQLHTAMPGVDPRSQWMIQGKKIQNRAGEYLDIEGGHQDNGAKVVSWEMGNGPNQDWSIVHK